MLINALTGKGLHVGRNRATRSVPVYVPDTPKSKGGAHSMCPFMTHPPYGYWEKPIGMGVKKKIS